MNDSKRDQLADAFAALPDGCKHASATEGQLKAFESTFGPIPDDFRWFLLQCGGGTIGSEWVDGIDELPETHRRFRAECEREAGWTMAGVFVIGWDGGGNPFGIETPTGKVLVEDHNFGGIHELAPSFEAFLERGLLSNR
ncbi:SMI1/KNR4 family protein [Roseimaritima sediminicola]|uniref:SMI1/KNR4 family protein n=1 Tax=Roseimaritima sediminicola TaxID=2662066 RepID=UPI0012984B8E|nr:SMI1/KNR4 family protein [Roseimaritima sediminicola]